MLRLYVPEAIHGALERRRRTQGAAARRASRLVCVDAAGQTEHAAEEEEEEAYLHGQLCVKCRPSPNPRNDLHLDSFWES